MTWRVIEWLAIGGILVGTVHYTLSFGWLGLAYCALAAAMGMMVVYYFADVMPILGPYLRRMQPRKSDDPSPPAER